MILASFNDIKYFFYIFEKWRKVFHMGGELYPTLNFLYYVFNKTRWSKVISQIFMAIA
jgi:hypothetical protein